jgi:hypothetical protein
VAVCLHVRSARGAAGRYALALLALAPLAAAGWVLVAGFWLLTARG